MSNPITNAIVGVALTGSIIAGSFVFSSPSMTVHDLKVLNQIIDYEIQQMPNGKFTTTNITSRDQLMEALKDEILLRTPTENVTIDGVSRTPSDYQEMRDSLLEKAI